MTPRTAAVAVFAALLSLATTGAAGAADNELTPDERRDGWVLLFDGRTPAGWTNRDKPMPAANVQDGAINPHKAGAYITYFEKPFDDFVLACDFKVSPGANSGIFIRTADQADPVQRGFEIQIHDSAGKPQTRHSCGALYDAVAPSVDANKPAGEWNHIEITATGSVIKVVLNGKPIVEADVGRWTEAGKNPDGTKNKFARALKDFPRAGYIGLQDHNAPVWFKNIKVKPLKRNGQGDEK